MWHHLSIHMVISFFFNYIDRMETKKHCFIYATGIVVLLIISYLLVFSKYVHHPAISGMDLSFYVLSKDIPMLDKNALWTKLIKYNQLISPKPLQNLAVDKVGLLLYESKIYSPPSLLSFTFTISKNLVVYTAHLYRTTNGEDFVIILIGASQRAYKSKLIIGCGVGNSVATNFKLRYLYEDIRQHRWRKKIKQLLRPYQQLAVECYGVNVTKGDRAFIIYKNVTTNKTLAVQSDQVVAIPAPRITPVGSQNISTLTCTKVLSKKVTWLPEFLRYQKTLGVDHVHVSILDTFIKDGGFHNILKNDSFFNSAVEENFITVQIWKEWYGDSTEEWFYFGNILMYLDCIYRYRGTYDFVSLFDTDDFLTVRVPGMSYKDFLMKYCLKDSIGSCSLKWLFYYPGVCGLKTKVGQDGNVTASLVPHAPVDEQRAYKSIHLSNAIRDTSFHDASCNLCLLQGYRAVIVPDNIAYVTHNRLYVNTKQSCL